MDIFKKIHKDFHKFKKCLKSLEMIVYIPLKTLHKLKKRV